MIHFCCANCGAKLRAPENSPGQVAICTRCGGLCRVSQKTTWFVYYRIILVVAGALAVALLAMGRFLLRSR
jgi:uncharacterized paraquat-inducible protein A